ncbi:TIGR02444 family protein [Asticcacaulis sp. EMRT-3]|uniref:TIGR02444 family protein n=1 Tax=Asticcacaulis sp. EMRT-3 TaxID=3040349 RepID=UPI0024AEA192|nr:TIGR02444 family protein [Asticcacaulis sp. EMRT-3]MDI7775179.1 TIGR02444 family protein [Asticcacaulis sp. EMRT-3]
MPISENGSENGSDDFWKWALKAYAAEGVAEACLDLQDAHDQCVPLLLWAAWAGPAAVDRAGAAALLARDWQVVILPLRAARRRLKTPVSEGDSAERVPLRAVVKAAELQAERALMTRLAALVEGADTQKSILNHELMSALRAVAGGWSESLPEAGLARLAQALMTGGFSGQA